MVFGRQDHYSLYLLIVVKSLIYGRYHLSIYSYNAHNCIMSSCHVWCIHEGCHENDLCWYPATNIAFTQRFKCRFSTQSITDIKAVLVKLYQKLTGVQFFFETQFKVRQPWIQARKQAAEPRPTEAAMNYFYYSITWINLCHKIKVWQVLLQKLPTSGEFIYCLLPQPWSISISTFVLLFISCTCFTSCLFMYCCLLCELLSFAVTGIFMNAMRITGILNYALIVKDLDKK